MSGCIDCGAPTSRRQCKQCELAERYGGDDYGLGEDGEGDS